MGIQSNVLTRGAHTFATVRLVAGFDRVEVLMDIWYPIVLATRLSISVSLFF